ncbi:MAG: type II secretion system F family protein [Ilumatobacteraceae bacterium]
MSTALLLGVVTGVAVAMAGIRSWAWAAPTRRPGGGEPSVRHRAPRWFPRRREHAPDEVAVAAWCERVAAGVRAGSTLTRAVTDADTTTAVSLRPFPGVSHALARGRNLASALDPVSDGPATPVGLLAPIMIAAAELGGPAAPPLERVADTLLARAAEREERHAASAQARLSARVLTTMPFGVLALLAVAEPSIRHVLVTPAGLTCLVAGSALNLLGWWWARHLIGRPS